MTKNKNTPEQATRLLNSLSSEQACAVGASVGSLLKGGLPIDRALDATVTVADFLIRGLAAQQEVDAILKAERLKRKS